MAFVFLILCLLLFFNTKRRKKKPTRTLWNEIWGLAGSSLWGRCGPASREVVVSVSDPFLEPQPSAPHTLSGGRALPSLSVSV